MFKTRKKRIILPILILTLSSVFFLWACGGNGGQGLEEGQVYNFKLYYANSDYVETGDESLGVYIVESRKLEVLEDENPWIIMLEELKKPGSDQLWSAVEEGLVFKDVYVDPEDPEILYVDLKDLQGGGSLKEGLFIGQVVKTAIVNGELIDEDSQVDKVQFLINGEIAESLMGHYESFGPFGMEDI